MPPQQAPPHSGDHSLTPRQRERKHRVLSKHKPSQVRSIADAVVIKNGAAFFLCDRNGQVPMKGRHGLGLYYHDCRFLNGYELRLAGKYPDSLAASAAPGFEGSLELTNPDYQVEGRHPVEEEDVGIRWRRLLDPDGPTLREEITLYNHGADAVECPVALTFRADFKDVFIVRGLIGKKMGKSEPPKWEDGVLRFLYEGRDKIYRSLQIRLDPAPDDTDETTAHFQVHLPPQAHWTLRVTLAIAESDDRKDVSRPPSGGADLAKFGKRFDHEADEWVNGRTAVRGDSLLLNDVMDRSLRDLHMLRTSLQEERFFAAGVPWFVTLFGRDSIITSLQTLAYEAEIAEQTLRLLARYQGTKEDAWKDEEPGKILHELRVGELAHTNQIPHTPYYGSVDSTPLFLILMARHAAWTGKLDVFNDLRENAERALEWIDRYGDRDGDGYVEYRSGANAGLANQGWKDSGNALVNADGSLARPPIALVEVQAYVYAAKFGIADLFERSGDADRAAALRKQAKELRDRFNRDFWMADEHFYALALQEGGEQAAVISSNPGQALWTGIVPAERAGAVAKRLMADDMFSGWGVRTLSSREKRYNPIGYHIGTVWPHDNSIIAAGFRRYGLTEPLGRVLSGITHAAVNFPSYRLPEVFCGFARSAFGEPVRYPVACHPQAWAAGSVPFLMVSALGLVAEGFDNRLRVVRPILPDLTSRVEVIGLRVGDGSADLRFTKEDGLTRVEILKAEGGLKVTVEEGGGS